MTEVFLEVKNLSKAFAGVQALNDVSFTINKGEIQCLIGQNGSGKSTLIKMIGGVYEPDSGEIIIDGHSYKRLHPIESIREGIQIIFQDFSLFPNLTVAENIAMNRQLAEKKLLINYREIREIAREALESINIKIDLDALVGNLSVADKQLIAISRALLQNARLIIMDEPTTALTQKEVDSLFKVIIGLKEKGISILFVSHKLNEVMEIAERVMVFRNGRKVEEGPASQFSQSKMVYYMTGQNIEQERYEYEPEGNGKVPLLEVKNLNSSGNFRDISFDLHNKEILGITGLLGSGRTELALALFGMNPAQSGEIYINGSQVQIKSVGDALIHGIGYVPEDRLTEGLFLERPIGQNILVTIIHNLLNRTGLMDKQKMGHEIRRWVGDLSIKTDNPENAVKSLSGGNQQRVVIAKWLAREPKILILNGPTVGVDIGSKTELHNIIRRLAREGLGVIVISDDITELLHTCNRILLMQEGRVVNQFKSSEISEDDLARQLAQG